MNKSKLSEKVMKKIEKEQIEMRPKLYFVFGSILTAVGLAGSLSLSSFLLNVVIFRVRMQRIHNYLGMGPAGIPPFVRVFPWELLGGFILVLGLGIWLMKKYEFSYKNKSSVVVLGSLILILVLTLMIHLSPINRQFAEKRVMGGLYGPRMNKVTPPPHFFERKTPPRLY